MDDHRPRRRLFDACAIALGFEASSNDRGVIINGIIELDTEQATVFYWVLSSGGAAFVVTSCVLAFQRLTVASPLAPTGS